MSDSIVVKPRNKIPVLSFKKINPFETALNILSEGFYSKLFKFLLPTSFISLNTKLFIFLFEWNTQDIDLDMDIYEPVGDTLTNRPLILFLHSGAFFSGNNELDDIVDLSIASAKRGYVAASINYRLGLNVLSTYSGERAVYRGVQDASAAIRYFRMDDEFYNNYNIDINRIFAGGISAGAIGSVNAAYLDDINEIPNFLNDDLNEIGGLEGLSGSSGYSSEFNGVVNLCGAVGSRDWIIENDIPIVSMHGNQDDTVPYDDSLVTLFGLNIQVDGSYIIHEKMLELNNYSQLYTYENQGHVPFSDMRFETDFSRDFLYDLVCYQDILIGDLNQDFSINISDVVILINLILGNEYTSYGDLNYDDTLNVQDIILLVDIILDN